MAAKVARVLLSLKPALHMAPMYSRLLFSALSPANWDAFLPLFESSMAAGDLEYWLHNLKEYKPKSWVHRDRLFEIWGDISETAFGGHSPLLMQPIVQEFSLNELAATNEVGLSSVYRDTRCARICIETLNSKVSSLCFARRHC